MTARSPTSSLRPDCGGFADPTGRSLESFLVPTYQYACTECDHAFEIVQSFSEDSLTECPNCGGKLRKVFNAVGVVFKGSGFYRTDSRSTGSSGASTPSTKSPDASSSSSSSGDSGTSSSKGSEKGASTPTASTSKTD